MIFSAPLMVSDYFLRIGLALILLFVINSLFNLLPLQLLNPAWQTRITDLLISTAPFSLLGMALIFLGEEILEGEPLRWLPVGRIRQLAPLAALGFLLLVPLQINAYLMQFHTADQQARTAIRSIEGRVGEFRAAASNADLLKLTSGLPAPLQPLPQLSLADNRSRLLQRIEPQLARLRTVANDNKSQAIQKAIKDGSRNVLLCLTYAWLYWGMRFDDPASGSNRAPKQTLPEMLGMDPADVEQDQV